MTSNQQQSTNSELYLYIVYTKHFISENNLKSLAKTRRSKINVLQKPWMLPKIESISSSQLTSGLYGCLPLLMFSHTLSISNVGGISVANIFHDYIDDLHLELEKQGIGCFWKHRAVHPFREAYCYSYSSKQGCQGQIQDFRRGGAQSQMQAKFILTMPPKLTSCDRLAFCLQNELFWYIFEFLRWVCHDFM